MPNPFVHVELNSTDPAKAKNFYSSLFNWKLEDMPMPEGTYTLIDVGGGTGGGMMKQMMPGATSAWMPYVDVEDLDGALKKAKSLGATVLKDKTEVPNMGWFGIINDPTGATIGLWKAKH